MLGTSLHTLANSGRDSRVNPFDQLYATLFTEGDTFSLPPEALSGFVNTLEGVTLNIPGVDPESVKVTLMRGNKLKVTYPDNVKTYTFKNSVNPGDITTECKWGQLVIRLKMDSKEKFPAEVDIPVAK